MKSHKLRKARYEAFQICMNDISKYGLNSLYAGKHWAVRRKNAEYIHSLTAAAVKEQCREVHIFDKPVTIRILYNTRMDIDNHGYLTKMIIDGMKDLLIADDNRKYVREVTQGFHNAGKHLIFVEVKECESIQ